MNLSRRLADRPACRLPALPRRSGYLAALLGSTLATGVATYGFLVLAERGMTVGQWTVFSVFWSTALVVGFGFFLPIEQEASRFLRPGDGPVRLRPLAGASAGATVAAVLALAVISPTLSRALGGDISLLALVLLLVPLSAIQFFTRGALLGLGPLGAYPFVLFLDAALRLLGAALLLLTGTTGVLPFAVAIATAVLVSHVVPLILLVQRPSRSPGADHAAPGGVPARWTEAARGWALLLPASLAAQVLQNGAPLAVSVTAADDATAAGRFLAAFTLARIPLFVAVPVQSALVPPLARLVRAGRGDRVLRLVTAICGATTGLGVVGGAVALVVGPPVLAALFGEDLLVPAGDLALMVVGVCIHVGLVVMTQALVAMNRHAHASSAWLVAVSVAAGVFLIVQPLLLRAELAFLLGSLAGNVAAGVLLVRGTPRRVRVRADASR